jgi:hypothetical protein
MSPKNKTILFFFPVIILIVGLACNMPLSGDISSPEMIRTVAARTLQARQTEISQPTATSSIEVSPTSTEGILPTTQPVNEASLTPTSTMTPAGSSTPKLLCNQAAFVKDVSIPDGTDFAPGVSIEKTWRLKNTGTCTWDDSYAIVVSGQDSMNAANSTPLIEDVAPGDSVDLTVDLTTPDTVGTYRTNFLLRSGDGEVFGTGTQNKPFYVIIDVIVAQGITFDFNTESPNADWYSGTGNNLETELIFGGADDDPNGVAKIVEQVKLEGGKISGKLLLTYPKHVSNGFIQGVYPQYLVQPGDHLKGRLGFMLPTETCGDGLVNFEIYYRIGDKDTLLDRWKETCNGTLTAIDLDLTSLKGKTLRFVLVVKAGNSSADDWAVWNSLGVEHK